MSADATLDVQVYKDLESLQSLRSQWEQLLQQYSHSTTFSTWEWLTSWWRAFARNDQLCVLAFRNGSSLIGIAPLSITRRKVYGSQLRVLRFMGDGSHDSDNLDIPLSGGRESEVSRSFCTWLQENHGEWDICELHTMASNSPLAAKLVEDLKGRGWTCYSSTRPQSLINLPETWDAYLKMLSSKERGKVGNRYRKLEKRYQLKIYKCESESELDACLNKLFELHAKHWNARGLPGTLHVAERRQFYRDLGRQLLARKRLEFWLLDVNGQTVATHFGLRHEHTVFSLQEGFDPAYHADSVGYVLRSQVLKTVIADGVRRYDFLGGVDDSKLRWGAEVRNYVDIDFARPLSKGGVYLRAKYGSGSAKQWLRANLPQPVWRKLQQLRGHRENKAQNPANTED
ncbi:MAG TPA: GNAT family N-acetyltransferase [Terriglobales bacterium]|nr:GNAT family N-acetyltransferase [Terriglobales bacterium]